MTATPSLAPTAGPASDRLPTPSEPIPGIASPTGFGGGGLVPDHRRTWLDAAGA